MITGFNTDVDFDGKTYHVQTEDKGLETPFILTLVYDRGTILARKQQYYEDLFTNGFNENALAERLQRQHNLICAAVNAGRINDLIKLTKRQAEKTRAESVVINNPFQAPDEDSSPIPRPNIDVEVIEIQVEPEIGVMNVIEEPVEIPNEAIEIVSDLAGRERPTHNKLCLEFINETPFRSGEKKSVTFLVCRGSDRKVVSDAEIWVKIIGSNFRPQIFQSLTDQNGLAQLEVQLPEFNGGRAAFLVRAANAGDEVELRRAITQT